MWILKVEKGDAAGGSGRNSALFEVFLLNTLNIKSNTSFLGTRKKKHSGGAETLDLLNKQNL